MVTWSVCNLVIYIKPSIHFISDVYKYIDNILHLIPNSQCFNFGKRIECIPHWSIYSAEKGNKIILYKPEWLTLINSIDKDHTKTVKLQQKLLHLHDTSLRSYSSPTENLFEDGYCCMMVNEWIILIIFLLFLFLLIHKSI